MVGLPCFTQSTASFRCLAEVFITLPASDGVFMDLRDGLIVSTLNVNTSSQVTQGL